MAEPDPLNPGSPEAVAQGCKCPVLDNCHGKGYLVPGSGMFVMSSACPLHRHNDPEVPTEEGASDGE